jgi:polygalacturonase
MANAIRNCFLLASLVIVFAPSLAGAAQYNVLNYGAKPDGRTDSTKAFLAAWTQACGSISRSTLYVPPGRYFLRNVQFSGPCKNNAILVRIDGSLLAPTDYRVIGNAANWISFQHVDGVTVSGGILDGHGSGLWDCKQSGKNCPSGATVRSIFCDHLFFFSPSFLFSIRCKE